MDNCRNVAENPDDDEDDECSIVSSSTNDEQVTSNGKQNTSSGRKRYLAAFDFDHTIVKQNTDTVCRDMLLKKDTDNLRPRLREIARNKGWTKHMATVFHELYKRKVTPERILDEIRCLPEVQGMCTLLRKLHDVHDFDLIIISDSNSVFIDTWLQGQEGLTEPPLFQRIYTNPAYFDANGLLHIRPYHKQKHCTLSAENLCKGHVLSKFIRDKRGGSSNPYPYERVFYIGDGSNDVCPAIRLRPQDVVCARMGYSMAKELTAMKNTDDKLCEAQLVLWTDGDALLQEMEKYLLVDVEGEG